MAFSAQQIEAQLIANDREAEQEEAQLGRLKPGDPLRRLLQDRLDMLNRAQKYWMNEWSKLTGIRVGKPTVTYIPDTDPEPYQALYPHQDPLPVGPQYNLDPTYIDNVVAGHYDVATGQFTVTHADGSIISLDYKKILADLKAPTPIDVEQRVPEKLLDKLAGMGYEVDPRSYSIGVLEGNLAHYRDLTTGKIYPRTFNATSAPNIVAMVLETEAARGDAELMLILGNKMLEIPIITPAGGVGNPPKLGDVVPQGARASRTIPGIVGNMARIGQMGAEDCLIASVQTVGKQVIYRVDAISAVGAEAATIKAAHRQMIRAAAEEARQFGLSEFTMVGKQANANFRQHADDLARAVGIPNSGKVGGGVPPLRDYGVTLNVQKVLMSNVE